MATDRVYLKNESNYDNNRFNLPSKRCRDASTGTLLIRVFPYKIYLFQHLLLSIKCLINCPYHQNLYDCKYNRGLQKY